MRSRTSRGVSEWLGGKDLYMGSHILGSGKRCSFFGIVPRSFQKVPEDSRGVQESTSGSTMSQGLAWAEGRCPSLFWLGAPCPQKPMWLGKGEKGGVLVGIGLDLESKSSPPWLHPRAWRGCSPRPSTYIYIEEGAPQEDTSSPWRPSLSRYFVAPPSSF